MSEPLLRIKPSPLSVVLRSFRESVLAALLLLAGHYAGRQARIHIYDTPWWQWGPALLGGFVLLRAVIRESLLWQSRTYELTPEHVSSVSGIFRRTRAEIPLRNLQQIVVDRTLAERLAGLGTILLTSAGSQTVDVAWIMIARAGERSGAIRDAADKARPLPSWLTGEERRPVVIGLAGGIGSGKSAVARLLGERGYIVVDSDRESRAALDLPDVRRQLVAWWGEGVIDASGRVDRRKIASIIFADPLQRTRLETLVHPIVKATRAGLLARAEAEGRPGVIVDAPLLFEAGSDKECDYVLFVDAPEDIRAARVLASRGWDRAELLRRQNAQLPLERKRQLSDGIIVNDAGEPELRRRVDEALANVLSHASRRATP